MSKQKKKKEFKKPIVKEESFIEENNDKKSIILIIIAIIAVVGLILASFFLFEEEKPFDEKPNEDVKIKEPVVDENTNINELAVATQRYFVKYVDINGEQLGKIQKLLDLDDRVNERAPKIEGKRFREWIIEYNKKEKVYYCYPIYVDNVERIPLEEELYLDEEKGLLENTYQVALSMLSEEERVKLDISNPFYNVDIYGEVEEINFEERNEELTISEEYSHIIGLRFNAPEGTTKEDIESMYVYAILHDEGFVNSSDRLHFNGEVYSDNEGNIVQKTGRDLLDSTDEEYENDIFYFNYYQEVDTATDSTVVVYWGNDPEENINADSPVYPKDEYVEVYEINVEEVELEHAAELSNPSVEEIIE